MLMPLSVADWLPGGHLAWFVIDVVDELDLSAFLCGYRPDGRGGAAYSPAMMVALLVYAYSVGERSSRSIERRCVEDVAFRVVAANQVPDHATIARFRVTHAGALAALFGQVLALCARAGLVRAGLLAVDGTRLAANAARSANRTAEQLAAEILAEADAVDAAESDRFGDARGDELPAEVSGPGRRARLQRLLRELEDEEAEKSYEAHIARRAEVEEATGRPVRGRRPKADSATHRSRQRANTTDPDSRLEKVKGGYVQGYNAQAVVTADQFIVAAEVTNEANDVGQFAPMITAAKSNLRSAGGKSRVRTVVADAGYWSNDNAELAGVETLIAPGKARHMKRVTDTETARSELLARVERGEVSRADAAARLAVTRARVNQLLRRRRAGTAETLTTAMVAKLATPRGKRLYKKRSPSVEPVFAQIKHNRGIRTFSLRGLPAVDSEWKLIAATHNLLKLWRHNTLAPA